MRSLEKLIEESDEYQIFLFSRKRKRTALEERWNEKAENWNMSDMWDF